MKKEQNVVVKNRFVISKKMTGQGLIIRFENKQGQAFEYDHDAVVAKLPATAKACFDKYGNYTNTNKMPKWAE
jgi:hypothetical protein